MGIVLPAFAFAIVASTAQVSDSSGASGFARGTDGHRPRLVVAPLAEGMDAPRIDGDLGDPAWEKAARLGDLVQVEPVAGAIADGVISKSDSQRDFSWDAIWQGRARVTPQGWEGEMRIPVSSISHESFGTTWGFNLRRNIPRTQERLRWADPEPSRAIFDVSQAGRLEGLVLNSGRSILDVRPFLVGDAVRDRDLTSGRRRKCGEHRPGSLCPASALCWDTVQPCYCLWLLRHRRKGFDLHQESGLGGRQGCFQIGKGLACLRGDVSLAHDFALDIHSVLAADNDQASLGGNGYDLGEGWVVS